MSAIIDHQHDEEFDINISVTLGTADLRIHQLLKLGRGADECVNLPYRG